MEYGPVLLQYCLYAIAILATPIIYGIGHNQGCEKIERGLADTPPGIIPLR